MKINSLDLCNYRCFEHLHLELDDRLTVLVGNNGAGKTTVLDALSVAIGTFLAGIDGAPSYVIKKGDVLHKCFSTGSTIDWQPQYPVSIKAAGVVRNQNISWMRSLNSEKGRITLVDAKPMTEVASTLQSAVRSGDKSVILPILSYYGTGRLWAQKKEKKSSPFGQKSNRFDGYADCLDAASNEKLMLKWFERMTLLELQQGTQMPELEVVRQAVVKCFSSVADYHKANLTYNVATSALELAYTDPQGVRVKNSIKEMSDGYRNTLSMIADIAFRMAILNPDLLGKALIETPGVVLIDEVDLHLHPSWQQHILADLTSIFPKVQFVVTTHAPAVINTVHDKNLLILMDGQAHSAATQTYGRDANSILREIMGGFDRPAKIKARFDEVYDLIDRQEWSKAKKMLKALKTDIGDTDPELVAAQVTFDLESI